MLFLRSYGPAEARDLWSIALFISLLGILIEANYGVTVRWKCGLAHHVRGLSEDG